LPGFTSDRFTHTSSLFCCLHNHRIFAWIALPLALSHVFVCCIYFAAFCAISFSRWLTHWNGLPVLRCVYVRVLAWFTFLFSVPRTAVYAGPVRRIISRFTRCGYLPAYIPFVPLRSALRSWTFAVHARTPLHTSLPLVCYLLRLVCSPRIAFSPHLVACVYHAFSTHCTVGFSFLRLLRLYALRFTFNFLHSVGSHARLPLALSRCLSGIPFTDASFLARLPHAWSVSLRFTFSLNSLRYVALHCSAFTGCGLHWITGHRTLSRTFYTLTGFHVCGCVYTRLSLFTAFSFVAVTRFRLPQFATLSHALVGTFIFSFNVLRHAGDVCVFACLVARTRLGTRSYYLLHCVSAAVAPSFYALHTTRHTLCSPQSVRITRLRVHLAADCVGAASVRTLSSHSHLL